ncbi:hypothetical protein FACS1894208_03960 [Clostridia bacterium]|nr:hypothetical protein FACS1894208_03960 [Clostridia bacterium]
MIKLKHITVFAGHYGSGKTQIAINYALWLREQFDKVALVDLDVVNAYFRSADAAALMKSRGIQLIASQFAGSNVDAPSIPPDVSAIFDQPDLHAVVDLGGDERGALALGRYAERFEGQGADILMVINRFRMRTGTDRSVLEMKREIEAAAKVNFTGIVNNSNLGWQTEARDIIESEHSYSKPVSEMIGLPLEMTSVRDDMYDDVIGWVTNPFALSIFSKEQWTLGN